MQTFIQTSQEGRISAVTQALQNPDDGIWRAFQMSPEQLANFNDYKIAGGQIVYDKRTYTDDETAEMQRMKVIANIPEIIADTDAAICELYEMLIGG